jgi:hypothetical protein
MVLAFDEMENLPGILRKVKLELLVTEDRFLVFS